MTFALAPYFHPTTVVFVDDNENFLRSLDLELPSDWAFEGFTDAEEALVHLNQPPELPPLVDRCFSVHGEFGRTSNVALDLSLVEQEIKHLQRFARRSVVMIDYAMPHVNGLEFCAELTDPYVQKAMLTGVADEKVAVQAFNARLIDRFIPKNASHSVADIVAYAEELQRAYFQQHTARLTHTLSLNPPRFLTDREVARAVHGLIEDERVVEYYMLDSQPGFLMLRADGTALKVLLAQEPELREQSAAARRYGAPADVQSRLDQQQGMLTFVDAFNDYSSADYPWVDNVVDAHRIASREPWYMGVIVEPPSDIDYDPSRCSYDAFLREPSALRYR